MDASLFKKSLPGLVWYASKAGLRDPEATAMTAVAKYLGAVGAGRLPADDPKALMLVLIGQVRDERRAGASREIPLADIGEERLHAAQPLSQDDWLFRQTLLGALKRMSPARAAAWLLHNVHGLTFHEVGEIIGITRQAAQQACERARVQLTKEVYR